MTLTSATVLEQQQILQQDAAIEDLYLSGVADGYDGKPASSEEYAYHLGYAEGLQQYNEELIRQCNWVFSIEQPEVACPF